MPEQRPWKRWNASVDAAQLCIFTHVAFHSALSIHTLPKKLTVTALRTALKPAIASKQYGSEEILSSLVAEAALNVMPYNPSSFNVDNIRVVKIMGGNLSSSKVVRGMVFGREPEGWRPSCRNVHVQHIP